MEQDNISLQYGMYRTPSLGNDGELSECVNLIPKAGELVNIQEPQTVTRVSGSSTVDIELQTGETLLYIHHAGGKDNYIVRSSTSILYYRDGTSYLISNVEGSVNSITSVGNVLIISTDKDLIYYIFEIASSSYKVISKGGSNGAFPKIRMAFDIKGEPRHSQLNELTSEVTIESQGPTVPNKNYYYDISGATTLSVSGQKSSEVEYRIGDRDKKYLIWWDDNFKEYIKRYKVKIEGGTTNLIEWTTEPYIVVDPDSVLSGNINIIVQFKDDLEQGETYSVSLKVYRRMPWTGEEGEVYRTSNIKGSGTIIPEALISFLSTWQEKQGQFVFPFFIRYAVKLAGDDDEGSTYVGISSPILMVPNIGYNPSVGMIWSSNQNPNFYTIVQAITGKIQAKLVSEKVDFHLWENLVESICVFISRPIYTYNQSDSISWEAQQFPQKQHIVNWGMFNFDDYKFIDKYDNTAPRVTYRTIVSDSLYKSGDEIYNELISTSEFRLYAEIPLSDINDYADNWTTLNPIDGVTPITLESEQLRSPKASEYYVPAESWLSNYNNRLLLAGGKSKLFEDFDPALLMSHLDGNSPNSIIAKVKIETEGGVVYVYSTEVYLSNKKLMWFYYPNPNAVEATFYILDETGYSFTKIFEKTVKLKPHKFLHGAYWLCSWTNDITMSSNQTALIQREDEDYPDAWLALMNHDSQYISRGNALSVYPEALPLSTDTQDVNIGLGNILAVSTVTEALSQGQYGQFPLYAFCSDGIWSLPINDEGKVGNVKPLNREVCTNPNSVTQIDNAVVFVTNQGLKLISGKSVLLLSEAVEGYNVGETSVDISTTVSNFIGRYVTDRTPLVITDTAQFVDQVQTAKIVYDYPHQLLHIFPEPSAQATSYKHYVYSLDTKQWSTQVLSSDMGQLITAVPGYPLSTMQFGNKLYQYQKLSNNTLRAGYALTRPLSLGDPLTRKSLYDLRVFGQRTLTDTIRRVAVYVSNDNVNWYQLKSLKAMSAKYYRFLVMAYQCDIDTISGLALQYDYRYNHKMRSTEK